MTPSQYRKERTQLIAALKKLVQPLLHATGYVANRGLPPEDPNRYVHAWTPTDEMGKRTEQSFKLNGFVLEAFEGFTSYGVIDDAFSGGLSTKAYEDLPLEDLVKLNRWAERYLPRHLEIHRMVKELEDCVA